jgi:hypothetical protein
MLSPSLITIGTENFLKIEKLLRSLPMWCDTPESKTNCGAGSAGSAALAVREQADSQSVEQSPVVARAALVVVFFTLHHCFIHLWQTQSTLTPPGSPH